MLLLAFLSTLALSAQAMATERAGEYDERGFKLPTPFATEPTPEPTCSEDFLAAVKQNPKLVALESLLPLTVAIILGWKVRQRVLCFLGFYLTHLAALAFLATWAKTPRGLKRVVGPARLLKSGVLGLLKNKDVFGLANCTNLALFVLPALVAYNLGVLIGMFLRSRHGGIKHQVKHLMEQKLGKSKIELAAKEAWSVTKKTDDHHGHAKTLSTKDSLILKASMKTIVGAVLVADDKQDTSRKLKKRQRHGKSVTHDEELFLKAIKAVKSTSDSSKISPYDAIYCALRLKLLTDPSYEAEKEGKKKKSKSSKKKKSKSSKKKKTKTN